MWYLDLKKGWVLKNWCFQIVKTLESPLDCQRSNQSILKKIKPEYSVEGLMLKLQYFGHAMHRPNWLEKTLILGKIEGRRRRGQQRMMVGWHHQLSWRTLEQAPRSLDYLNRSHGWEFGTGPSIVVLNKGVAASATTTTLRKGIYAFISDQKGVMAGLGLQGNKIIKIKPEP